jgi:hypothetical protein
MVARVLLNRCDVLRGLVVGGVAPAISVIDDFTIAGSAPAATDAKSDSATLQAKIVALM